MSDQDRVARCARCGKRLPATGATQANGVWFGPECIKAVWSAAGESDEQYFERKAQGR